MADKLTALKISKAYIGGSSQEAKSVWKWVRSHEPFKYTKWHSGEPNDPEGSRCVFVKAVIDYHWDDIPCGNVYNYICEKNCTPTVSS
ncbi:hypothetical protein BsWGS_23781 [Bradybaena similaris]